MCNCRSPSRGEKTILPRPLWALQLHDSVERSGAGDGVHRRGTVSEGIQTSFRLKKKNPLELLSPRPDASSPRLSRPTPEISWTKVSGDLPAKRTSFLHYQKTLRIVDVSESDAGEYRCVARNQLGSVHQTIHVMVKGESPV